MPCRLLENYASQMEVAEEFCCGCIYKTGSVSVIVDYRPEPVFGLTRS